MLLKWYGFVTSCTTRHLTCCHTLNMRTCSASRVIDPCKNCEEFLGVAICIGKYMTLGVIGLPFGMNPRSC